MIDHSQAVPLPSDVAFPEGVHEIEIVKVGDSRVISPVGRRWDAFFARQSRPSDDLLRKREQGRFDERERL